MPGVYPPLAGSEWVLGSEERLIRIVLHGLKGPVKVKGLEFGAAAMPVRDTAGHVRGALSVSALLSRFDAEAQERALAALSESAERLASHLPRD